MHTAGSCTRPAERHPAAQPRALTQSPPALRGGAEARQGPGLARAQGAEVWQASRGLEAGSELASEGWVRPGGKTGAARDRAVGLAAGPGGPNQGAQHRAEGLEAWQGLPAAMGQTRHYGPAGLGALAQPDAK